MANGPTRYFIQLNKSDTKIGKVRLLRCYRYTALSKLRTWEMEGNE